MVDTAVAVISACPRGIYQEKCDHDNGRDINEREKNERQRGPWLENHEGQQNARYRTRGTHSREHLIVTVFQKSRNVSENPRQKKEQNEIDSASDFTKFNHKKMLDCLTKSVKNKQVYQQVCPTAMNKHGSYEPVVRLVPHFDEWAMLELEKQLLIVECLVRYETDYDAKDDSYGHF